MRVRTKPLVTPSRSSLHALLDPWTQEENVSLERVALKLSNELHGLKTTCAKCMGASATKCRSCLHDFLVGVRAGAALDEPIEALWPGRLRSSRSCLHPRCQRDRRHTDVLATLRSNQSFSSSP
jgi:hypothetical protein